MLTTELQCLVLVASFTALLWAPYVLDRMLRWGLINTVGYPADPPPLAGWAQRMKAAHANAVENLVVFAPLVLVAHAVGLHTPVTQAAATVFVVARVLHALLYTLGVPWLRTLAFVAGFGAQLAFASQLLHL